MTIKQFIKKAVEGGWMNYNISVLNEKCIHECIGDVWKIEIIPSKEYPSWEQWGNYSFPIQKILLDPLAWQAVGKVEGWSNDEEYHYIASKKGDTIGQPIELPEIKKTFFGIESHWKMHRMIDALCEGKSIEEFLKTL